MKYFLWVISLTLLLTNICHATEYYFQQNEYRKSIHESDYIEFIDVNIGNNLIPDVETIHDEQVKVGDEYCISITLSDEDNGMSQTCIMDSGLAAPDVLWDILMAGYSDE